MQTGGLWKELQTARSGLPATIHAPRTGSLDTLLQPLRRPFSPPPATSLSLSLYPSPSSSIASLSPKRALAFPQCVCATYPPLVRDSRVCRLYIGCPNFRTAAVTTTTAAAVAVCRPSFSLSLSIVSSSRVFSFIRDKEPTTTDDRSASLKTRSDSSCDRTVGGLQQVQHCSLSRPLFEIETIDSMSAAAAAEDSSL